ncbi:MAG TPA: hypothetical protein VHK91_12585 [Flavisolibacter sp.]|jgi:hypothetical protein|nr:hypothetical protein [Flavisolibacter sp.]
MKQMLVLILALAAFSCNNTDTTAVPTDLDRTKNNDTVVIKPDSLTLPADTLKKDSLH